MLREAKEHESGALGAGLNHAEVPPGLPEPEAEWREALVV